MSNMIDIQVESSKQQIRLNGDDSRIIELDLSDSNIIVRFNDAIPRITALINNRDTLQGQIADSTDDDVESFNKIVADFAGTENEMRTIINDIFDYDVCTPFAGKNSVFSIKNGTFLYETIIETLIGLYEKTIREETAKLKTRMKKHTKKYF